MWNADKLGTDCHWLTEEELIARQTFHRAPVPDKAGDHLLKRQALYLREKALVYGLFFVKGRIAGSFGSNKKRTICSPLLIYPARIDTENSTHFAYLNSDAPQLNTRLLSELVHDEHREDALSHLPKIDGALTDTHISNLVSWIQQYTDIKDALYLLRYPKLSTQLDDPTPKALNVFSSAAVMLVDRPKSSSGIIHELKSISQSDSLSAPITKLLSNQEVTQQATTPPNFEAVPGLLSQAQKAAITIASEATLGLISGPPGTGKSYTIAATVADRVTQNETVLIVCETEQAIDVIEQKLDEHFFLTGCHIRTGDKAVLKALKDQVASWLNFGIKTVKDDALKQSLRQLHQTQLRTKRLEKQFIKRNKRSMLFGRFIKQAQQPRASLLSRLIYRYIKYRLPKLKTQWSIIDELQQSLSEREQQAAHHIKLTTQARIEHLLNNHRSELVKFNQAIRARSSGKQADIFNSIDPQHLLQAFPVWLVTADTLHRTLPLKKEMFDVVLIDEATQCNIAAALPALYRAKRALIVGDAKQLKHVSFLSKDKERELLQKNHINEEALNKLSYRDNSILHLTSDAITTQKSVTMLDEHFRSKQDIIAFSNHHFYDNRLKIMQHRPNQDALGNVHLHRTSGTRCKKGTNAVEIERISALLEDTIDRFKNKSHPPSIGIISPFRHQAEAIAKQLNRNFTHDTISRHNIRASTPYGFQGEERDIMLLSFAIDNDSLRAAGYLRKEDMFNVAITRARQTQHVFFSFDPKLLPNDHLIKQFIEYYSNVASQHISHDDTLDSFQAQVCKTLNEKGVQTWKGYPIAGRKVDILCHAKDKLLAIDLIGFPGPWQDYFELETYKIFNRANLSIFPLSYGLWVEQQDHCLDEIIKRLN